MKTTLLGLFMTMAAMTGCAHQTLVSSWPPPDRDLRGSARVGHDARMIVAGPAVLVHATGEKPVRWFVVERVSGGDQDCAAVRSTPAAASPLVESTRIHVTVAAGHLLCAAVAQGATEVTWHQVVDTTAKMWALR